MEIGKPRTFLDPDDIGILVVPNIGPDRIGSATALVDRLKGLGLPVFQAQDHETLPWTDHALLDVLQPPQWRQIIILAETVQSYEVGLVLMCLEMGFQVYLALPDQTETDLSVQRLRQATAIILSHDTVIDELRVQSP